MLRSCLVALVFISILLSLRLIFFPFSYCSINILVSLLVIYLSFLIYYSTLYFQTYSSYFVLFVYFFCFFLFSPCDYRLLGISSDIFPCLSRSYIVLNLLTAIIPIMLFELGWCKRVRNSLSLSHHIIKVIIGDLSSWYRVSFLIHCLSLLLFFYMIYNRWLIIYTQQTQNCVFLIMMDFYLLSHYNCYHTVLALS